MPAWLQRSHQNLSCFKLHNISYQFSRTCSPCVLCLSQRTLESAGSAGQSHSRTQAKVRSRDQEIQRLHERLSAGLDVDKLSLQRQHETSEQLVLRLSQQVDIMNTQIADLEKQVSPGAVQGPARMAGQWLAGLRSKHLHHVTVLLR